MYTKVKNILRCHASGMGIKETALTFHISRNTVRKYVRMFITSGKSTEQMLALSEEQLRELFGIKDIMEQNQDLKIIQKAASELKLPLFRDSLNDYIARFDQENWSVQHLLAVMMQDQLDLRAQNRRKALIKRAEFPQLKYLAELVVDELPEDARAALPSLRTLDFIRKGQNVVLYGNPGTGKTLSAIALGIEACSQGMTVLFTSVPRLITQIKEARQERTLRSLENKFINYDLVICDEFGYVSCDKEAGELLFNHLSLRAGKKSIIITTNLAFNRWSEIIADKVLVAAMVDRLTHKALLINMTGVSFRLKETQKMFNL